MSYIISIITPVYNGIRFIDFCINNVIEQKCLDVEHIIIDGGSTDGTVQIIKRYAERYEHIRWVSENDKGQSDALNKGIQMAMGSVVGSLNVDDYYEPGLMKRVVALFETLSNPSIAVGNCNVWREDGTIWFVSTPRKLGWENILAGKYHDAFPMNSSAYFYHKSLHKIIGPYNVEDHYSLDVDFMIRALQSANFVYCDETWGNYRYLPGTKTYQDDMNGENEKRLKELTISFIKRLSLIDRIKLWWIREVG